MKKAMECRFCGNLPTLCEENSFIDDQNQWWASCHDKSHPPIDVGPCSNVEAVKDSWNRRMENLNKECK
jgi:hypothetical protein